jgi:hypothetical protein
LLQAGGALQVPPVAASWQVLLLAVVVAPVLEEFAFRGAVHDACCAVLPRWGGSAGPVSWANVITSIAFCACHLPYRSVGLACAVFLPSLLLGRVRETTGALMPCVFLHAWFNACFLAVFARGLAPLQ